MNIQVDELAQRRMDIGEGIIKTKPTLSMEIISMYTKDEIQITDIRRYNT